MNSVLSNLGGSGPPLILIHGFGADRMTWMFLAPTLMSTYTVYAVDLPGHGEASSEIGTGTIEELANSVLEVMPQSPMTVVGHSMGGAIALEMARRGAVSQAFLLAPAGLGVGVTEQFLKEFPEIETTVDAERVLGLLVSKRRLVTPQMAQYVISGLSKEGRREALRKIAAGLLQVDSTIPKNVPVTVMWGRDDAVNLAPKSLAGVQLHILDDVGHMPHVEAVSKVTPILLQ